MVATAPKHVISDDILARCRERAPVYDRENRFFDEDFEELRDAGYLLSAVPKELGGLGLSFAEVCQEQRRLAYYSAPTALAINMHFYWTGVAADLWRSGDKSRKADRRVHAGHGRLDAIQCRPYGACGPHTRVFWGNDGRSISIQLRGFV